MATNPTLDTLIAKVNKEVVDLEHRSFTNVTMRIDETIAFTKDVLSDLHKIKGDLKFNLTITKDSNTTVVAKLNGETVTAGSKKISAGDQLVFTVTYGTGYVADTLTVNGTAYVSGTIINVTDDVTLVATAKLETFDLIIDNDEQTTVTVTKGGTPIEEGSGVLTYGDVITITTSYAQGYEKNILSVNDELIESGATHTVVDNTEIIATASLELEIDPSEE